MLKGYAHTIPLIASNHSSTEVYNFNSDSLGVLPSSAILANVARGVGYDSASTTVANINPLPASELKPSALNFNPCERIDLSVSEIELILGQGSEIGVLDSNGFGITINGNGWNALSIPQNINADDVLTFEFRSTALGEEHAIGFSKDLEDVSVNGNRFKLYGTQDVPVENAFLDYTYTEIGAWQSFEIPVGELITGDYAYLVFVNDNDEQPEVGNSSFRNIRIAATDEVCNEENFIPADACAIDLTSSNIALILKQGSEIGVLDADGFGITINGNGWNALSIPQNINADDILTFEFRSTALGEEHAIGFSKDLNDVSVNGNRFKLYGTQDVPVENAFLDYAYTEIGAWQSFEIPVGELITGDYAYLVFVNDNDEQPEVGNSSFRNIRIAAIDEACNEENFIPADTCAIDLTSSNIALILKQGSEIGVLDADGFGITINGNGWNALSIPQNISADDVLTFEFRSTALGEEHAIGFSKDLEDASVNGNRFKLYGTQDVPVENAFLDYTYTEIGAWQSFEIPVGELITGDYAYLVFVNDNDEQPEVGNSSFRNIKIVIPGEKCTKKFTPTGDPSIDYSFNFATSGTVTPKPFITDSGNAYGAQDGLEYGWILASDNTPIDASSFARNRKPNPDADVFRESFIHMNRIGTSPNLNWEIAVPNDTYRVVLLAGDPENEETINTHHLIKAEGVTLVDFKPGTGFGTRTVVAEITVTDGKLTLDGSDGFNAKLNAISIQTADGLRYPAVVGALPKDGAIDVSLDSSISANFLSFPNINSAGLSSLDNTTITSNTVKLYEVNGDSNTEIAITVNGTGGGDAINLSVAGGLKENTRYRYIIRGVQDLAGGIIFPYAAEFITGVSNTASGSLENVVFSNQGAVSKGKYSSLLMGPDSKLYGLQLSGNIDRWIIGADGSLINKETLTGLTDSYGGDRLAIGLAFAPNATASNLVAYVTHSMYVFNDGPVFDGNISRLTGSKLENEELIVTNLPRSIRDHLSNSIVFDPNNDNVLYFNQGSNSAGGQPDDAWGNRPERLLSAAALRLDLDLLPANLPLDVKTTNDLSVINNASNTSSTMSDGSYNPYFNNAPLTIFGSGIRNPYDLIWHSNGQLYIPTNGTAGGSNSPASVTGTRRPNGDFYNGPDIPLVLGSNTQRDFLFRIDPNLDTGYFGHPNPLRGEYVLNSGSASSDQYPSGITADSNYRGFAFDFEFNKSPNGIIEYKSSGALQGALLVCRYSGGSDLIALIPDGPNGDIKTSKIGISGFTGLVDPLDLVEDPKTGNIYVSDLRSEEIIFLKLENSGLIAESPIAISFATPADGDVFKQGEPLSIEVLATTKNQTISKVDLFLNDVAFRTVTEAPYNWNSINADDSALANLAVGDYKLKAIATDNAGDTNEVVITISIEEPLRSDRITISFTTPEEGDVFGENDPLVIDVLAESTDSSISKVDLFVNDVPFRTDTQAPYTWNSANVNDSGLADLAVGDYTLKVVATDNEGNTNESTVAISIIEQENSGGAEIFVENMRKIPGTETAFPYNDRIVFHRAIKDADGIEQFSEYSTIRIRNTGTAKLNVSEMVISNQDFEVLDNGGDGMVIEAGAFEDVVLRFVASTGSKGIREANLTIFSDDANKPETTITLVGGYMSAIGGSNELIPEEVMEIFGFQIRLTGSEPFSSAYPTPASVDAGEQGDLVVSQYWEAADTSQPVTAFYTNAFMSLASSNVKFVDVNDDTVDDFSMNFNQIWHQTFFPRNDSERDGAIASKVNFVSKPFALSISGRTTKGSGTNETTGLPKDLAVRMYKVINIDGTIRPDEYFAIMDFAGERGCVYRGTGTCDFNDVGVYITNIKPAAILAEKLGAKTANSAVKIVLFPNPAGDFVNIYSPDEIDVKKLHIYDISGRAIESHEINYKLIRNNTFSIRTSHLETGIYTVQLDLVDGTFEMLRLTVKHD